jgi:DNA-binding NarL/FixJ family response regulator
MTNHITSFGWWIFWSMADLKVRIASNLGEALLLIQEEIFRALIIDLNIPVDDLHKQALLERGSVYAKYPGLFAVQRARNKGYRDRQVVIYSVHKDQAVAEEARKLGATYILKGRPKEIKEEIQSIISFDPTEQGE